MAEKKKLTVANTKIAKKIEAKKTEIGNKPTVAPQKLLMLVTIVNRNKADFYIDLIESFECNLELNISAFGTAQADVKSLLNITDDSKTVILSVIRQDKENDVIYTLNDKFKTVRGGKGIAFTVPMTSTIGVALYRFLSNNK